MIAPTTRTGPSEYPRRMAKLQSLEATSRGVALSELSQSTTEFAKKSNAIAMSTIATPVMSMLRATSLLLLRTEASLMVVTIHPFVDVRPR